MTSWYTVYIFIDLLLGLLMDDMISSLMTSTLIWNGITIAIVSFFLIIHSLLHDTMHALFKPEYFLYVYSM